MERVLSIVNLVLRILAIVVLVLTTIFSLLTAYIVLAPDEFPKPFHLAYQDGTGNLSVSSTEGASTPAQPQVTATATAKPEVKSGEGLMVNMTTKIVNLQDPGGRKYIRATMVLEFRPEGPVKPKSAATAASGEGGGAVKVDPNDELTALINTRMPLMDDIVITILSSKTYDDLYTTNGKEVLRKEIVETINQRLPEFEIISVYFTEFVVQ